MNVPSPSEGPPPEAQQSQRLEPWADCEEGLYTSSWVYPSSKGGSKSAPGSCVTDEVTAMFDLVDKTLALRMKHHILRQSPPTPEQCSQPMEMKRCRALAAPAL